MSNQQTSRTYWQSQGSSSQTTYQRFPLNQSNPNANSTSQHQPYMHHANQQAVANQTHADLYDSLFPTDTSANPPGYRQMISRDNQTFLQGPAWTSTPGHCHDTRLPTSATVPSQQVTSLHNVESVSLAVQPLVQQPTYSHNLHVNQQAPQSVWRQPSQQLSDLPSLQTCRNQELSLPRVVRIDGTQDCSAPGTHLNESSITVHPVPRKANDTISMEASTTDSNHAVLDNKTCTDAKDGDGWYCKLCDVVCSGPLNLKMHLNRPKHKQNEDTASNRGAVRSQHKKIHYKAGGFVPKQHNQQDKPIVGLDFVTRVVSPDNKDDMFECSLCDKSDITSRHMYLHVMAKAHRLAYIRKLKPDLSEQYSTVAEVYKQNVKLQQRESSDLPVLLNSMIKIAAKSDGPGQTNIRLSNERESDDQDQEDQDYNEYEEHLSSAHGHHQESLVDPLQPLLIQPSISPANHSSATPHTDSSKVFLEVTVLPCNPQSVSSSLPSQEFSFDVVTPHIPSSTLTHSIQCTSTSHQSSSQSQTKTNQDAELSLNLLPDATNTIQSTGLSQAPSLTADQLRPYCSDVFISQEHQRRFGNPPLQDGLRSSESNRSIRKALSDEASVDILLKSLSDTEVNSEADVTLAMDLARALTQATLKYRLKQKNDAKGRQGNEQVQ